MRRVGNSFDVADDDFARVPLPDAALVGEHVGRRHKLREIVMWASFLAACPVT